MTDLPARLVSALSHAYRLERELGQGGMATVYLAQDLKHDRRVAIKVLKPDLAAVLGAERFIAEIKTTAALSHPHILPLFDSGEAGGFLYYVMPYIEGETIRDRLNRQTQLAVDEAVRITREVADALDYAHRHGVIHRDQDNADLLMLNPSGQAPSRPYLDAPWNERDVQISPDRRLAAFVSSEQGVPEIVVREFPVPENKWSITLGQSASRFAADAATDPGGRAMPRFQLTLNWFPELRRQLEAPNP